MQLRNEFDVIIIGGSYAGLSAAMSLGRSLRAVLIIDGNKPCNRPTPHAHNLITHDGTEPRLIALKAKEQTLNYPTISFEQNEVISGCRTANGFQIITATGANYHARKLILATGIKDLIPAIRGFQECWGISLVHCPYCHGYEFRDKKTAIIANGDKAFHLVSLINNLTTNITVFTNGQAEFTPEQLQKIKKHRIEIIDAELIEIQHNAGQISAVVLRDGRTLPFDVMYAALPFTQHSDIATILGCELTPNGHIRIDHAQSTTVKGVYACGDCAAMMRSLANAIAMGNLAGAMVNKELTETDF